MKLISMTDFVLEQGKKPNNSDFRERFFVKVLNYANFLKQPLTLGMFVPCDDDGNVLEEPSKDMWDNFINSQFGHFNESYTYCFNYQEAKSKVIFEDFVGINTDLYSNGFFQFDEEFIFDKSVEDLICFNLAVSF